MGTRPRGGANARALGKPVRMVGSDTRVDLPTLTPGSTSRPIGVASRCGAGDGDADRTRCGRSARGVRRGVARLGHRAPGRHRHPRRGDAADLAARAHAVPHHDLPRAPPGAGRRRVPSCGASRVRSCCASWSSASSSRPRRPSSSSPPASDLQLRGRERRLRGVSARPSDDAVSIAASLTRPRSLRRGLPPAFRRRLSLRRTASRGERGRGGGGRDVRARIRAPRRASTGRAPRAPGCSASA